MYLERKFYRHFIYQVHLDCIVDDYDHEKFKDMKWFLHIIENCSTGSYDFFLNLEGYGYWLDMFGIYFFDENGNDVFPCLQQIATNNLLDYMYQYLREVRV